LNEYGNSDYKYKTKDSKTELESGENIFEPLDEEGLDNVYLENNTKDDQKKMDNYL